MAQLADVYRDVNQMVGVQGQQIDQAAGNVEVSESNMSSGATVRSVRARGLGSLTHPGVDRA